MDKKSFLLRNKILFPLWIIFHAGIILAFLVTLFVNRGINVDADLFNMLPSSTLGKAMGEADQRLSSSTARSVFILVGHEDFQKAKSVAGLVYESLKDNENFTALSLYSGTAGLMEIEESLHPYRAAILDDEAIEKLSTKEGAASFRDLALSRAYGSFTVSSLGYIDEDPFLLDEYNIRNTLFAIQEAGTQMGPKDGVLASNKDGTWYVMIRGTLSEKGAAIASKNNGIAAIYEACAPLEKDGISFVYSGTSFHSHKSSNSALKEITIISTVSIFVVILMLVLVFKTALPLLASLASIFVSVAVAFSATHLVFGKLHILTLVLGTSLIGSCIDYSLHYFVNWKAHTVLHTTEEIRSHLFKGLFLSLLSTEVCYFLLVFAPFDLLKQMGVFSFTGILSSFLSVICIYPLFPVQPVEKRKLPFLKKFNPPSLNPKSKLGLYVTLGMIVLFSVIIAANYKNLGIKNDMYKLYVPQGKLKEDNALAAQITGYAPKGWFIIHGETEEEVLEHEEALCAELKKLQKSGYLATTRFVPSLSKQERSVEAVRNLLPLAQEQFELLGFETEDYEVFKEEFEEKASLRLYPESELPGAVKSVVNMLYLGKIEDLYYSVVLPVTVVDEKAYVRIAEENGLAYYENKMEDLGKGLDALTKNVIVIFLIAYFVILIILKRFYSWKQVLKIASVPLVSVLLILAVFMLIKQKIEFFGLTGLILVFGLGLDYVIYMIENMRRAVKEEEGELNKLEPFAIVLSFITTAVSFGALALSTFVPVHTIGLTIFLGLIAAFVCTLF